MLYLVKNPAVFRWLYPTLLWQMPTKNKTIYLTFDDGVTPELTPFIVAQLDAFDAKATFFLVGQQSEKYPELVALLLEKGHSLGNHTHNHCNGWKTDTATYCQSVADCAKVVQTTLFRPPYGKISRSQIRALAPHYKIVMWDVIAGDFDPKADADTCLRRLKKYARSGSIVVLHDNARFAEKVRQILPPLLQFYKEEGYKLEGLP